MRHSPRQDDAMTQTVHPKRMYLAYRHPTLSPEAFIPRWRQHGALAMQFMAEQGWQNVTSYSHCDAIRDSGLTGVAGEIDGVGMFRFHDLEARRRHVQFQRARSVLEADEDSTFGHRVNRTGWVADERVFVTGGTPRVALMRVITRDAGLEASHFETHWQGPYARDLIAACGPALRRYVQDWPLVPEFGNAWGLTCTLIDELWFDELDALKACWAQHQALLALSGESSVAPDVKLVPVREVVLRAA